MIWDGSGVPGRLDNVVHYAFPDIGGFDAAISYVPEEGADDFDHLIAKGSFGSPNLTVGVADIERDSYMFGGSVNIGEKGKFKVR